MFIISAAHTNPSTIWTDFSILPYTLTNNNKRVAVIAVLLPIYSNIVCQYAFEFSANKLPVKMPTIPASTTNSILIASMHESTLADTTNISKE